MGRYFALALEAPSQIKTKTKAKAVAKVQINWGLWFLAVLVVLSVMYLLEVNTLSTQGYEIKKLERQLVQLKETEKKLQLEGASLQSIQSIQDSVKALNLVPSKAVNYPQQSGYAYQDFQIN